MDISELKRKSDLSYDIAIAKRNALEKAHSRQVVVYNQHIFRADPNTINLVKTLMDLCDKFFILDTNDNPVEITEPNSFLELLVRRNQESLSVYQQMYKTFEKRDE